MKHNLLPALIIALAIVSVALLSRQSGAAQVRNVLTEIEQAVQARDEEGKSQIERISYELTRSVSQGAKSGFQGDEPKENAHVSDLIDQIEIRELKIAPSQFKSKERVIGILRNNSDQTLENIQLNVIFKDSAGTLVDVSTSFAQVKGVIKPGAEVGFEVDRSIGEFSSTDEELLKNRSAAAVVTVQNLRILK